MSASSRRAEVALLSITVIWAAAFVWVKDALADADPFSFLTLRFAVGAALTCVLAGRKLFNRALWVDGVRLGALLFLGYALQTWGLAFTSPSRSAFITGLCVVLVPIFGWVLLRQKAPLSAVLGASVATAGLFVLTNPSETSGSVLRGDVLTLGCAGIYALHILFTSRLGPRHSPMALVAVQLVCVTVLSATCLPFTAIHVEPTPALIRGVVLGGLLASALAIVVQTWAQSRTTAVRAALLYSLEPVFAALIAAVLGRDVLTTRDWIGGALTVAGVLVGELGATRQSKV